jgi:2-polyprenyl-6-methoxyphenol hydroxylase-like FAD-dependent oxidoreductase
MSHADVLIVGAGPTGLVLALWLVAQGVTVRIIDKSNEPGTASRALAVHARTLELYRQLGIGDAVAAAGHQVTGINMWTAGKRRAHVPINDFGGDITPYPFVLIYPQDQHERFLVDRLQERGINVERATELVAFEDHGTGISASLRRPDGSTETCTARYIAGCDGARSSVRQLLGAGFEGGTYEQLFYVADVEAGGKPLGDEVHIAFQGPEFVLVFPYGKPGQLRLVGTVREEKVGNPGTLTFEDVGHQAIEGLDLQVERVHWFSTYHVHHRVTERFRRGNAFLLGDAAHVHSPAGGQGMNTGIGDAINLAWKLAAVLKAEAGERLLDSYEEERPAFARKLVETTDRVFTLVTAQGSLAEFVRTRVAPVFTKFAWSFHPTREALFRVVSQTMLNYPESALSVGKAGKVSGGDRLPYVRFDGRDNYDSLSRIAWQVHVYGAASDELRQWCKERRILLHEFTWHEAFDEAGLGRNAAYLLRPDSYVAVAESESPGSAFEAFFMERDLRPNCIEA